MLGQGCCTEPTPGLVPMPGTPWLLCRGWEGEDFVTCEQQLALGWDPQQGEPTPLLCSPTVGPAWPGRVQLKG